MASQALCTFDGIAATKGWEFTLNPGVRPSMAFINTTPSNDAGNVNGTLVIVQDSSTLTFPGCQVVDAFLAGSKAGRITKIAIQDRRWKWQFAVVEGYYNEPIPGGGYRF